MPASTPSSSPTASSPPTLPRTSSRFCPRPLPPPVPSGTTRGWSMASRGGVGFVNGELNEIGSVTNETWVGGPEGNWWACFFNENGLEEGLYELVLNVAGQSLGSDSIFVGGAIRSSTSAWRTRAATASASSRSRPRWPRTGVRTSWGRLGSWGPARRASSASRRASSTSACSTATARRSPRNTTSTRPQTSLSRCRKRPGVGSSVVAAVPSGPYPARGGCV